MAKKGKKSSPNSIVDNRKARHDFSFLDTFEAGLQLEGWEVKSLRAGKAQLVDSYVIMHRGEAWLVGAQISPLNTASSHIVCSPKRDRKLLLNAKEIDKIMMAIDAKGLTCVCLGLYWKGPYVKAKIALAQGKKAHDKRAASKDREWAKQKERTMKMNFR